MHLDHVANSSIHSAANLASHGAGARDAPREKKEIDKGKSPPEDSFPRRGEDDYHMQQHQPED